MFGKIIYPLIGVIAFIWLVASPSEGTSMSPAEAIERAIPQLQVEIDPMTRKPAPMAASSIAFELEDGRLLYKDDGMTVVTRRRVRRTAGTYRPLPLPPEVKSAVIALGGAWRRAADEFPADRTLYQDRKSVV